MFLELSKMTHNGVNFDETKIKMFETDNSFTKELINK